MRESSPRLILREKAAAEMQRPFCVEKVRLSFVQPLSLASLDSSPSRGASGEEEKFSALPKPPLGRGGGSASALTERLSPAAAHGQASLRTTSQSASQTAPLVGEPLAKPFTLQGLPKPLPLGEVSPKVTERASPARKRRRAAIGRLFVRAIRSLYQSCLAAALPSQALRASSPKGRAFGARGRRR